MTALGHSISTDNTLLDREWLIPALQSSYWGAWLKPEQIEAALESSLCFGMYVLDDIGLFQIGFARVVTDGVIFSAVMDVIVDPKFRGQGYGTALMQAVIEHPKVRNTICVLDTRDGDRFYSRLGFVRQRAIMKRDPI